MYYIFIITDILNDTTEWHQSILAPTTFYATQEPFS